MAFQVVGKYAPIPEINPIEEYEADILGSEGLAEDAASRAVVEHIERTFAFPATILGMALPKSGWRLIEDSIRKAAGAFPVHSALHEQAMIAADTASKCPHATRVLDALTAQYLLCMDIYKKALPEAQMLLRHHAYLVVQNEFMGRNVG